MNPETESPRISDRGSHIEVILGVHHFRQYGFAEVLLAAGRKFGAKPILVICDDPAGLSDVTGGYDIAVRLSAELALHKIAIALRGRPSSSADHLIEQVAQNRGVDMRYFESVLAAKAWLGVS